MLRCSDVIGTKVQRADGTRAGRVVDLAVGAGEPHPAVTRVALGRGRRIRGWVAWSGIASFEETRVTLREGAVLTPPEESARVVENEIHVVRDVLDTQILDAVAGTNLVRVADVVLARSNGYLQVVAVEVGAGAVVRRLGLHRLSARFRPVVIDWNDLHLASTLGLATQFATRGADMRTLSTRALGALVAQIATDPAARVLDTVSRDEAAAVLSAVHPDVGARLVHALPQTSAAAVIERMAPDDAVAALRRLPPADLESLLARVGSVRAGVLRRLLEHHPDTAGGFMTTDVRTARETDSLDDIRARLAADPPTLDALATVFVLDDDDHPVGVIDPVSLITGQVQRRAFRTIPADMPVGAVIDLFATHDFLAVPVVDAAGRLVGAVAVDDVFEELLAERLPGGRHFAHLRGRRLRLPPRATRRQRGRGERKQ
jgi:sporulation protein YlmC with PRC-barrel domain